MLITAVDSRHNIAYPLGRRNPELEEQKSECPGADNGFVGTAERWIEQQIKARNRRLVRKHWWRLALIGLTILGLGVATWLTAPVLQVPLWAVIPAICLCGLYVGWQQLAGTYNLIAGRDAEAWTSKELRKRCGPGWRVIDGLQFRGFDVDHVLVGPGGVYSVETKYTDDTLDLASASGQRKARQWIGQAQRGSRSVRSLLRNVGNDVYPIVVVWGNGVTGGLYVHDGCPVLHGRDLAHPSTPWQRGVTIMSPADVEGVAQRLEPVA